MRTEPPVDIAAFSLIAGHPALDLCNTVDWRLEPDSRYERLTSYDAALAWARVAGVLTAAEATAVAALPALFHAGPQAGVPLLGAAGSSAGTAAPGRPASSAGTAAPGRPASSPGTAAPGRPASSAGTAAPGRAASSAGTASSGTGRRSGRARSAPERELDLLRDLRETTYRLVIEGGATDARVVSTMVADAVRASRLSPADGRWDWAEPALSLATPRRRVVLALVDLLRSPAVGNVRRCADDSCGWVYLDTSPRKNRLWCVAGDCGNRNRVRRHYERRRARTAP